MEKLKNTTIAAIAAGVIAVAGVGAGLGITQPWKQNEEPAEPEPPAQTEVQEPSAGQSGYFLTIGGKQVPSLLYEGKGWSILYPETWELTENPAGVSVYPEGAAKKDLVLTVGPGSQVDNPTMVSCFRDAAGETVSRLFHTAGTDGNYQVSSSAPADLWEEYKYAFAASARSFTLNGAQPFQNWSPLPEEPQWQETEGVTVLWLDKDGVVLDESAKKAADAAMRAWDADYRSYFNGQYRIDSINWRASYTNLDCAPWVEVFEAKVRYQLSDSAAAPDEAGTKSNVNGWYSNDARNVLFAVLHDGESVKEIRTLASGTPGLPDIAALLNAQ